ncbi:glycosyl hydrolase [Lophiotrema nucula]|uniref:Glycosyl hydrolase n=1 Tax=Lophiotrema nucula TaxID=690887 RepID=A0A6A5YW81_9PLEO|nr:glycosyl hydrolase [Lophiotrema nucula]
MRLSLAGTERAALRRQRLELFNSDKLISVADHFQGSVIPGPPFAANVTGFRDPYVFQNPQLDRALQSNSGTWYATISGGIHGSGRSIFLYRQYESDLDFQTWEYLGQYRHELANTTWTDAGWAGRWGYNFEVENHFSLDTNGYNPDGEIFMTLGAEWSHAPIVPQISDVREMLWVAGKQSINNETGDVVFSPTMAGKLGWGRSAYAAAGKILTATSLASKKSGAPDRFISYVWLTGDYYGTLAFRANQQNWSSSLLLPRELSVRHLEVVDYDLSQEKGSRRVDSEGNGTVTLAFLGHHIAREPLAAFKANATNDISQPAANLSSTTAFITSPQSKHYVFFRDHRFPQYRSWQLRFSNESIIVDRSASSAAASTTTGIYTRNEAGKLHLFDFPSSTGSKIETLDLTIVVDGGTVEVHANGRFGISTWVWTWYADSRNISFFVEAGDVAFGNVTVWEGLIDAWPARSG